MSVEEAGTEKFLNIVLEKTISDNRINGMLDIAGFESLNGSMERRLCDEVVHVVMVGNLNNGCCH
jgi:hypothetical protein